MKIDLTSRQASIAIVLALEVLFYATAVAFSLRPESAALSSRLWELFYGINAALFLALNVGTNHPPPPPQSSTGSV